MNCYSDSSYEIVFLSSGEEDEGEEHFFDALSKKSIFIFIQIYFIHLYKINHYNFFS